MVLANLDCQTLLQLCEPLAQYELRARLLLSGILIEQEQEIAECFLRPALLSFNGANKKVGGAGVAEGGIL